MADKPSKGLADIIAASTALSDIDGRAGLLFYRGYDIHQLAGSATFEEIACLLQWGRPPTRGELASYADEIAAGRALGSLVTACLPDVAGRQSPMEAMRSLVSLAGADDPDKDSNAVGANIRKAPGSSPSSRSLSPPTMPRGTGARSALPSRSLGSPPTSCCRCGVRRRPRVRQRSSTPVSCCMPTTR
jgi:citrate synthase